jgi:hypothetical protein
MVVKGQWSLIDHCGGKGLWWRVGQWVHVPLWWKRLPVSITSGILHFQYNWFCQADGKFAAQNAVRFVKLIKAQAKLVSFFQPILWFVFTNSWGLSEKLIVALPMLWAVGGFVVTSRARITAADAWCLSMHAHHHAFHSTTSTPEIQTIHYMWKYMVKLIKCIALKVL